MVYQLVAGKTLVEIETHQADYINCVDGDFNQTFLIDLIDDGARRVRHGSFDSGLPIKQDNLPTVLARAHPHKQELSDYYPAPKNAAYVSECFRSLVEKLEPGIHQFFPMTVKSNGAEIGLLYYFVVGNRIDGLDHSACVPPIRPGDRLYSPTYTPSDKRVFNREKIKSKHLWHEMRDLKTWISDDFREAIFAEGLTGIKDTLRYEEIS